MRTRPHNLHVGMIVFAFSLVSAVGQTQSPTTKPAKEAETKVTEPDVQDILKQFEEGRPERLPILPSEPGTDNVIRREDNVPGVTGETSRAHLPDGSILVDRVGRLVRENEWWVFAYEGAIGDPAETRIRLLPNRALEQMEISSAGGSRQAQFVVTGEVTEFHGQNYLLVRQFLVQRDLGNLER